MSSNTQELFSKLETAISYLPKTSQKKIRNAYDFSAQAHLDQKRQSGEPYVNHVIATAIILAEIKLDESSIIAALLHDTLEDTSIIAQDIIDNFGEEVLFLVDGVTKVSQIKLKKSTINLGSQQLVKEMESLRKLFLAMAQDLRVVLIKLADRLHNLSTLQYIPESKQFRIAKETMEIYVPLANRLGLWQIKSDLEDYCFRYLYPEDYNILYSEVSAKTVKGQKYINRAIKKIRFQLDESNITYLEIYGRTKNLYGIYQKTLLQHKTIDEIYDIYAIRIITPDTQTCYTVLGVIHNFWKPIPGRFKDYIAVPKPNGYQSLHTSVFALEGQKLEIQIRTMEMHQHAEQGIAAHWLYKEKGTSKKEFNWVGELSRLKDLNITELSNELKIDIFKDRIFVYTPKGDVRDLPKGSTPIDFAYSIHSEIGHRLIGAKVNQKIVPLDYSLQNSDIVDILTSKQSLGPKRQWLDIAQTNFARTKIRAYLKKNNAKQNILIGSKILSEELTRLNLSQITELPATKIKYLLDKIHLKNIDDVYLHLSHGDLSIKKIIRIIFPASEVLQSKKPIRKNIDKPSIIVFGQNQFLPFKLSTNCCQPKNPLPIVGYITRGHGITVHLLGCKNIKDKDRARLIEARWAKNNPHNYTADLEIFCDDRVGMVHDISEVAMSHSINIISINTQQNSDKYGKIIITVSISDLDQLSSLLRKITALPGIQSVKKL